MVPNLDDFEGDFGTSEEGSIWLLGIEPGYSAADKQFLASGRQYDPANYSIEFLLDSGRPFTRNAIKLLCAIERGEVESFKKFAADTRPFSKGSGSLKGNLFPYACYQLSEWTEIAVRDTGFQTKRDYQAWCRDERWPLVRARISEHKPTLVIGVGVSYVRDFSMAVLGDGSSLETHRLFSNRSAREILHCRRRDVRLAVIPHLSRPLRAHRAIVETARFLANLQRTQ